MVSDLIQQELVRFKGFRTIQQTEGDVFPRNSPILESHIPHLSDLTAPLRELTKKDIEFTWTQAHQAAFDRIKVTIAKASTLSYFNQDDATTIQVDASRTGLGAALIPVNPDDPDV